MPTPQRFIPVSELEIIGYAEVLPPATPPRKVAPIFRYKAESDRFLFPPFRLIDDQVVNGTVGTRHDFDRLVANAQATPLPDPIPTCPSGVLWIDENLAPHYGPQRNMLAELRNLAREKYRAAKNAFANAQYDAAQHLARHAFAADERLWLALALQAAVDRIRQDHDGVVALKTIAADLVDPEDFDQEVERLVPSALHSPASIHEDYYPVPSTLFWNSLEELPPSISVAYEKTPERDPVLKTLAALRMLMDVRPKAVGNVSALSVKSWQTKPRLSLGPAKSRSIFATVTAANRQAAPPSADHLRKNTPLRYEYKKDFLADAEDNSPRFTLPMLGTSN